MAKDKNQPEGFEPPDEMDDTGAAPAGFKLAIEDDRYFRVNTTLKSINENLSTGISILRRIFPTKKD